MRPQRPTSPPPSSRRTRTHAAGVLAVALAMLGFDLPGSSAPASAGDAHTSAQEAAPPRITGAVAPATPPADASAHQDAQDAQRVKPPVAPPGMTLSGAPAELGLTPRTPSLSQIRLAMASHRPNQARRLAERYVTAHRWGRSSAAAWMVIGLVERDARHANGASAAFTHVRTTDGPLAPFGAYYEAEQDLLRGKPAVAVRECERYRETWPDGPHVTQCLRVEALGWAASGNRARATATAERYDRDHELGAISEQIALRLAEVEVTSSPDAAIPHLIALAVSHDAPLTGRIAEQLLETLHNEGFAAAVLPTDTPSLMARAISLRGAGRAADAWQVWAELSERATDDPRLSRWQAEQASSFGWRLRRWPFLIDTLTAQFEAAPSADLAWSLYKANSRGGDLTAAITWAELGQREYARSRRWRRSQDPVARTMMLAGRYPEARAQLDVAAARGGWSGRRAAFGAGFASFMAGDLADAVTRFDAIIAANRGHQTEAHYWRARAQDALDEPEMAAEDRRWIAENAPDSWYDMLDDSDATALGTSPRDGRWPGASLPHFPPVPTAITPQPPRTAATPWATPRRPASPGFAALSWRALPAVRQPPVEPGPAPELLASAQDLTLPPSSYRPGPFYDVNKAWEFTTRFSERHKDVWPLLPAIVDLASVGLYDLSGPLMAAFYDDVDEARRSWSHPRHAAAQSLGIDQEDWRAMFLATRDHHHAARFTQGLESQLPEGTDPTATLQLAMPLAHDGYLWQRAREQNLDPYLVMGLMRQESVYDANAVSRAGARGAMQIMPRTGHRIADLTTDLDYTAANLEDPILAIGYGLTYLSLLMARFDGVYPLAVASYNGGPHNVSTWLTEMGPDTPMDVFVEHIPFRETRGYVQLVSANYARYVDLYAPQGARVAVPNTHLGDHPEVVDF